MYTLNQLSTMTGLTTRTLRNYLNLKILQGDKTNDGWQFSEDQVEEFVTHPSVRPSIQAKQNAIVYDFLLHSINPCDESCVLLNRKQGQKKAEEMSQFFCDRVDMADCPLDDPTDFIRFAFSYEHETARFILSGSKRRVKEIMDAFYAKYPEEN